MTKKEEGRKQLRFAPLIRVSTEKQQAKGESLHVQKRQIENAVQLLGGIIPKHCWKYSGQEHATPDMERKKFDQLLSDSGKGLFDAVIVVDSSRWSRDNLKSEQGLQILKKNGIKFYAGAMEIDLYSPEQEFFLVSAVASGTMHAKQQALKSVLSRIARLRDNKPATGFLPYGRTYDKKSNTWGIDNAKQEKIKIAAKMFIENGSITMVSKRVDLEIMHLYRILKNSSGDTWPVHFRPKLFPHIDEVFNLQIPRLLPEKTIKAIQKKMEANKTIFHRQLKHKYLLGRMIFCAVCGNTLSGAVMKKKNGKNHRYYRHIRKSDRKGWDCKGLNFIHADRIEEEVMRVIFEMFGDRKKREQALKSASLTDLKEQEKLQNQLKKLEKEMNQITKQQDKLVEAVLDGTLPRSAIKKKMAGLTEREELIQSDILATKGKLDSIVTEEEIKKRAKNLFKHRPSKDDLDKRVLWSYFGSKSHLEEMTFEEKRELLQLFFAGKDTNGNRYGVYIKKRKNADGWTYEIKGLLVDLKDYKLNTSGIV